MPLPSTACRLLLLLLQVTFCGPLVCQLLLLPLLPLLSGSTETNVSVTTTCSSRAVLLLLHDVLAFQLLLLLLLSYQTGQRRR
jgi:hypothetical protein